MAVAFFVDAVVSLCAELLVPELVIILDLLQAEDICFQLVENLDESHAPLRPPQMLRLARREVPGEAGTGTNAIGQCRHSIAYRSFLGCSSQGDERILILIAFASADVARMDKRGF